MSNSSEAPEGKFSKLTVISSLLAKRCGHECEQGEPEGDKHAHIAQAVVAVQFVHQEDLKDHVNLSVQIWGHRCTLCKILHFVMKSIITF